MIIDQRLSTVCLNLRHVFRGISTFIIQKTTVKKQPVSGGYQSSHKKICSDAHCRFAFWKPATKTRTRTLKLPILNGSRASKTTFKVHFKY